MSITGPLVPIIAPTLQGVLGTGLPWESGGGGAAVASPVNTVAPVASGTRGVGLTLSCTTGTWTGTPTPTFTYQWQVGATLGGGGAFSNIGGATASTFVETVATLNYSVRCVVTATNAVSAVAANSNTLAAYDTVTGLPNTAIWVSTSGITTADAGTTVDSWASSLGGVSATLTATAATNRPAYSATGGTGSRPLVTGDGTDNEIHNAFTKGSQFASFEMGIVGPRITGTAGDGILTYESDPALSFLFGMRDVGTAAWRVTSNIDLDATSDPDAVSAHYSTDVITGTYNVRKNGTAEATSASAYTTRNDTQFLTLFARRGTSAFANWSAQAFYIGPLLTTQQRLDLRATLQNYTGVTS